MGKVYTDLIGPFSSRTPGTDATIKIPSTRKVHALFIEMNVATIASITRSGANKWADYIDSVHIRVNGSTEIELTPAVHELFMNTVGYADTANVLTIPLAMPNMRRAAGEDITGYGTADVQNLDVVVKLKSGAHTIDKLDLRAQVDDQNEPLGRHLMIRSYPGRNVSGAGVYQVNDIWAVGEVIYGLVSTATNFDLAELKQGNRTIHSSTSAAREAAGALVGRVNSGGFIDLLERDRLEEAHVVDAQDHRLSLTFDAAASPELAVISVSPAVAA